MFAGYSSETTQSVNERNNDLHIGLPSVSKVIILEHQLLCGQFVD